MGCKNWKGHPFPLSALASSTQAKRKKKELAGEAGKRKNPPECSEGLLYPGGAKLLLGGAVGLSCLDLLGVLLHMLLGLLGGLRGVGRFGGVGGDGEGGENQSGENLLHGVSFCLSGDLQPKAFMCERLLRNQ